MTLHWGQSLCLHSAPKWVLDKNSNFMVCKIANMKSSIYHHVVILSQTLFLCCHPWLLIVDHTKRFLNCGVCIFDMECSQRSSASWQYLSTPFQKMPSLNLEGTHYIKNLIFCPKPPAHFAPRTECFKIVQNMHICIVILLQSTHVPVSRHSVVFNLHLTFFFMNWCW